MSNHLNNTSTRKIEKLIQTSGLSTKKESVNQMTSNVQSQSFLSIEVRGKFGWPNGFWQKKSKLLIDRSIKM